MPVVRAEVPAAEPREGRPGGCERSCGGSSALAEVVFRPLRPERIGFSDPPASTQCAPDGGAVPVPANHPGRCRPGRMYSLHRDGEGPLGRLILGVSRPSFRPLGGHPGVPSRQAASPRGTSCNPSGPATPVRFAAPCEFRYRLPSRPICLGWCCTPRACGSGPSIRCARRFRTESRHTRVRGSADRGKTSVRKPTASPAMQDEHGDVSANDPAAGP